MQIYDMQAGRKPGSWAPFLSLHRETARNHIYSAQYRVTVTNSGESNFELCWKRHVYLNFILQPGSLEDSCQEVIIGIYGLMMLHW